MADPKDETRLESIVQKAIDAGQSQEEIGATIGLYRAHPALHDHANFAADDEQQLEDVVAAIPGVLKSTLIGFPKGVVEETINFISILRGQHPDQPGLIGPLIDSITNAPEAWKNASHEQRQQMVGELVAGTAVPMAMGKGSIGAARPVARGVGGGIEFVGKRARWPLQIGGSHAVLSGNPMGAALIAAPNILERSGKALREWGEAGLKAKGLEYYMPSIGAPSSAVVPRNNVAPAIRFAGAEKSAPVEKVPKVQLVSDLDRAAAQEELDALNAAEKADKEAVKVKAAATKAAANKSTITEQLGEGFTETAPTISKRISSVDPATGETLTSQTRYIKEKRPDSSEIESVRQRYGTAGPTQGREAPPSVGPGMSPGEERGVQNLESVLERTGSERPNPMGHGTFTGSAAPRPAIQLDPESVKAVGGEPRLQQGESGAIRPGTRIPAEPPWAAGKAAREAEATALRRQQLERIVQGEPADVGVQSNLVLTPEQIGIEKNLKAGYTPNASIRGTIYAAQVSKAEQVAKLVKQGYSEAEATRLVKERPLY